MMTKLLVEVGELTDKEYARANEQYPAFASDHEGHDFMSEEMYEIEGELGHIHTADFGMRMAIHKNDEKEVVKTATAVYDAAQHLAAEAIQVAAMAQKIIESQDLRRTKNWPVIPMLK